jgi:transcription elongation factor Elf1
MHKKHFLDESLKVIATCPVCQNKYESQAVKIVEQQADAYVLHINCSKCNSSVLAYAVQTPMGVTTIGLLTDLQSVEVKRFLRQAAISEDDVLRIYEAIHSSSEDLSGLLINQNNNFNK